MTRKNANLLQTEARAAGQRFYHDPKPCPQGHVGLHYTNNGKCKTCVSERNKKRRDDPAFVAASSERHKKWRAENKEAALANSRDWYEANRERHLTKSSQWKVENRDKVNVIRRRYYKNHIERERAYKRATVRKVRRARPPWADKGAIRAIYDACPPGMVVDHFAPINGKNICGLHVAENLQYLSPHENSIKRNIWNWETQNSEWRRDSHLPSKSCIS